MRIGLGFKNLGHAARRNLVDEIVFTKGLWAETRQ